LQKEKLHNEAELLRLVAQGDMQAFQRLFEWYWDQVYGAVLRLVKDPEQAKDLSQELFLKLWDNREKLPGVKNLRSYLYTIAKHLIYDQIRTLVFRESNKEFLMNYFSYDETSPQDLLEQKERAEVLAEAINKLPVQLRKVFHLRRVEGLSHVEIAKRLNISAISSKTYMVRALMALRKELLKNSGRLFFIACTLFGFL
jgi:RNA polymerase sigma-70 factor (ECF subfamily)